MSKEQAETFFYNFMISGSSAAVSKTLIAPIERTKLILQNQENSLQIMKGERQKYKGLLDCLIRLPREQGIFSYWRANGTNIIRYIPLQALTFSFHDLYRNFLSQYAPRRAIISKFLAGFMAGASTTAIIFPLEFCQTRLAVDVGSGKVYTNMYKRTGKMVKREFSGLSDCLHTVCKRDGFVGLYGGFITSIIGVALYRSFYFGLYETGKRLIAREPLASYNDVGAKLPIGSLMILAQTSTILAGVTAYPLDTVSRRMMLQSGRDSEYKMYKSSTDVFRKIYQDKGFAGFFKGSLTNCLRCAGSALVLVIYDEVLYYTDWKKRIKNKKV